ncbi:glycosyltransferase involved in cell wall biosynthesis [Microbacterium foliorum]|uniref:glycosyltransferase n=1 Tax=Microbacterium foliorum TaxID=104336 RepID=UPI0020A1C999|nr:glycosyltransferase [Microbacterium foliorum]MCP1429494.1 glycosyltransferase involved in cell wall biosynthesis [Microbacterium foliorum]
MLAAYDPNPELFARQIESLRAQTITDWECVVSIDGDDAVVRRVLQEVAADDERFRVIADGTRVGFYLNFERGLAAVDADAAWVALCDQDDHWYPEKLATLVPHLEHAALVSGQARLVTYPDGVTTGHTDRRDLGAVMTALNNQFTGSLCVLRGDLAVRSIPFPRMSTRAAAHDHWIAVLAGVSGGTLIVDTVVQDYVQHASNVFGDPSRMTSTGRLSAVRTAVSNARAFTRRYESSDSPIAMLRMLSSVYVGWRQLMAETLAERAPGADSRVVRVFGRRRRFWPTWRLLRHARERGYVPGRFVLEYTASWVAAALVATRRRTDATTSTS